MGASRRWRVRSWWASTSVHIGVDRDEASFQDYFKDMPWLAFPHGDERIKALNQKFQVSGIPWLVVLDKQGNLVVNEADTDVPQGPEAFKKWLAKAAAAA